VFTRLLAERLQASAHIKISEAAHGMVLEPGHAYIAPGDHHMRLAKHGSTVSIALDQGPQENSCRPAVDVLFRAVQETFGAATIAAILTGMGYDGLKGSEGLRAAGAYIIAQDEASSVVWGMPGAIANAGVADVVLPLSEVVPQILQISGITAPLQPPRSFAGQPVHSLSMTPRPSGANH
jgi:two-component system chemotaxis response regulator CheB